MKDLMLVVASSTGTLLVRTRGVSASRACRVLFVVVKHRHLALPFVPGAIVSDQLSHEVADVDSTGLAGIKDRASCRRRVDRIFRNRLFIDQSIRSKHPDERQPIQPRRYPG